MKSTYVSFVTCSLFFLLFVICSCESREISSDLPVLPKQQTKDDLKKFEGFANSTRGTILEGENFDWKTNRISIGNRASISAISFINEKVGWACNKTKIFKTEDSGGTWQSFTIDFLGKGKIAFLQFTNDRQGWLVLEDMNEIDYSKDDRISIYRTTDSGKSWNLSHSEVSVSFRDAQFSNKNGWVVGMKFVGDGARERSPFVLHFSDQDEWTDVSGPIKDISYDPAYREGDRPSLDHLTIKDDNCVIAVNKPGRIFQSCDQGKSWEILYNVDNFSPHSSFGPQQIGFQDNFTWLIESAGAIDGKGTILTTIPINDYSKKKLFSLPNYITQGFVVSSNEFFLVGVPDASSGRGSEKDEIILQTQDSGETWKKILSIPHGTKAVQFFLSQKIIWILTENGELIKATNHKQVDENP